MKILNCSYGGLTATCLLLCFNNTFATPVSEQQASNVVWTAVAQRFQSSPAPQIMVTPGNQQRTVRQVDLLKHNGNVVGYVVSLAPSGYYLLSTDDELPPLETACGPGRFH